VDARLQHALAAACAPEAVLCDLDGVLVDIEQRRALVDGPGLAALAARLPLGVVTGCPRRLAESVLRQHGLLAHVRALVCAEDAPPKPDPTPVRRCLQLLGATRAWFLGDNPGDVQSARGAGVVPLAVLPHGVGAEQHAATLRAAGAARLIEGVTAMAALLP